MNVKNLAVSALNLARQRPLLAGAAAVGLAAIAGIVLFSSRSSGPELSYFTAKRGGFLISIVEGGNVEAVNEVVIRNEVEGTARIIFIVPEGSTVKQGDLLVELDSSASQDNVNQQQIAVEKAQFALIQAEQQLEIQKSTVESEVDAAKLKVEFAKTDMDKFEKGEAAQQERNAQISITNVLESLKLAEEKLGWTEKLYAKQYETKSNLDRDRLAVSQGKLKMEQAEKELWMLQTFDLPKKRRELEAALQEAKENLDRVKLQGDRKLAQYKADVDTQKSTLELSKKKLERDVKQLSATKIYAPQDGLVVYPSGGGRFSSESLIEEGAVVRNRQELIKLPDITDMKLTVKIHESHINQITVGQPAFVVLDAMPDRRFGGVVNKVAPLPDAGSRWGNPNLKVYATEILITEALPNVKPGVSARAEVIITNLPQVITVPIQCVTTRKGQQVVYLDKDPQKPAPVSVGMYNTKFIEITSGVGEGDRVLLSPPFDIQDKDLGGAIMAEGDKMPTVATNRMPKAKTNGNGSKNGFGQAGASGPAMGMADEPGAARTGGEGREARMGQGGRTRGGAGAPDFTPGAGGAGFTRGEGTPGGPGQPGGGRGFNREEMTKRFDKNGDGKLDEEELAAMREMFSKGRGRRPGATNAPAEVPQPQLQ